MVSNSFNIAKPPPEKKPKQKNIHTHAPCTKGPTVFVCLVVLGHRCDTYKARRTAPMERPIRLATSAQGGRQPPRLDAWQARKVLAR